MNASCHTLFTIPPPRHMIIQEVLRKAIIHFGALRLHVTNLCALLLASDHDHLGNTLHKSRRPLGPAHLLLRNSPSPVVPEPAQLDRDPNIGCLRGPTTFMAQRSLIKRSNGKGMLGLKRLPHAGSPEGRIYTGGLNQLVFTKRTFGALQRCANPIIHMTVRYRRHVLSKIPGCSKRNSGATGKVRAASILTNRASSPSTCARSAGESCVSGIPSWPLRSGLGPGEKCLHKLYVLQGGPPRTPNTFPSPASLNRYIQVYGFVRS